MSKRSRARKMRHLKRGICTWNMSIYRHRFNHNLIVVMLINLYENSYSQRQNLANYPDYPF